jgi:hypothetical protein
MSLRARISRSNAKRALNRIEKELKTLISDGPNLGYDMDVDMTKADDAVKEAIKRIRWLYR